MTELSKVSKGHWLSRIDKYRPTSRANFGIGAVDYIGELGKEFAKNTKSIIITDKLLRKIGLVERPKKSLEKVAFTIDIYK